MLGQQPSSQRRQGKIRVALDMNRQGGLLRRRQLARPVTAPRKLTLTWPVRRRRINAL
jgi:hypothetical protein